MGIPWGSKALPSYWVVGSPRFGVSEGKEPKGAGALPDAWAAGKVSERQGAWVSKKYLRYFIYKLNT